MFSTKRKLKSLSYYNEARFGSFNFFNYIDDDGNIIDNLIKDKLWRKEIIEQDIKKLLQSQQKKDFQNSINDFHSQSGPQLQFDKIVTAATELFDLKHLPKLYIVEELPYPFNSCEWDAMSLDSEDEKRRGIPQGIYYRKSVLTHCYFEFIIAHELVHWVISENSKVYYSLVPWYEEGICDILGAFILLISSTVPVKAISNLFIYNRSLKPSNTLWFSYWNSDKQIFEMLLEQGLDSLISVVCGGRELISRLKFPVEIDSNFEINNKNKKFSSELNAIIRQFLHAQTVFAIDIDSYLILEKTIYKKSNNFFKESSIRNELQMPDNIVRKALKSLCDSGYIAISDNNEYCQMNDTFFTNIRYII